MNKEQPQKKSNLLARLADGSHSGDRQKIRDRMKLAARIDDLISGKGYTKQQFALLMGKEPSVISKWLSGTHNFTTDTLSYIAFYLNVELSELFIKSEEVPLYEKHYAVARGVTDLPVGLYPSGIQGTIIMGNDVSLQGANYHFPLIKTSSLSAVSIIQAVISKRKANAGKAGQIKNEPDVKGYEDYPFKIKA